MNAVFTSVGRNLLTVTATFPKHISTRKIKFNHVSFKISTLLLQKKLSSTALLAKGIHYDMNYKYLQPFLADFKSRSKLDGNEFSKVWTVEDKVGRGMYLHLLRINGNIS